MIAYLSAIVGLLPVHIPSSLFHSLHQGIFRRSAPQAAFFMLVIGNVSVSCSPTA